MYINTIIVFNTYSYDHKISSSNTSISHILLHVTVVQFSGLHLCHRWLGSHPRTCTVVGNESLPCCIYNSPCMILCIRSARGRNKPCLRQPGWSRMGAIACCAYPVPHLSKTRISWWRVIDCFQIKLSWNKDLLTFLKGAAWVGGILSRERLPFATICTLCEAPESNTIDSDAIQINCIIIIIIWK